MAHVVVSTPFRGRNILNLLQNNVVYQERLIFRILYLINIAKMRRGHLCTICFIFFLIHVVKGQSEACIIDFETSDNDCGLIIRSNFIESQGLALSGSTSVELLNGETRYIASDDCFSMVSLNAVAETVLFPDVPIIVRMFNGDILVRDTVLNTDIVLPGDTEIYWTETTYSETMSDSVVFIMPNCVVSTDCQENVVLYIDDIGIENAFSVCGSCDDGIKNGSEIGIDCGGPNCISCEEICIDGVLPEIRNAFIPLFGGSFVGQDSVLIFDVFSQAEIAQIGIGLNPVGVTVNKNSTLVYFEVSNSDAVKIIEMDAMTFNVLREIVIPGVQPNFINVVEDRLIMNNLSADNIAVLDLTNGTHDLIPLERRADHIRLSPDESKFCFGEFGLRVYDLTLDSMVVRSNDFFSNGSPEFNYDGSLIFAPILNPFKENIILVIDANTYEELDSINLHSNYLRITPSNDLMYSISLPDNSIHLVSLNDYSIVDTIEVEGYQLDASFLDITSDGSRLMFAATKENSAFRSILTICTDSHELLNAIETSSPVGIRAITGNVIPIPYEPCFPETVNEEILSCDSLEFNGTTYNESGTYQLTLQNAAGCDSVINLNLTIIQESILIQGPILNDSLKAQAYECIQLKHPFEVPQNDLFEACIMTCPE